MYQPADREKIYKLWLQRYKPDRIEKRREVFLWLEQNPHLMGKYIPYHIVERNGEIIGYYGKMPLKFMVKGKILDAVFGHDILVHLAYWGKGVADRLVTELKARSDSLIVVLWLGQSSYSLHIRCGWLDIKGCYEYVKIYNVEGFLKRRLRNQLLIRSLVPLINSALRLYRLLSIIRPVRRFQKEVIHSFDERFDIFAERVSKHFGIIALRDARYLTWKYLKRRYRVIAAIQESQIVGYVVFRLKEDGQMTEGLIVDILADPDQTGVFRFLVLEAVKHLRTEKADSVRCLVTYPKFRRVLRECGFIRARQPTPFMCTNWQEWFSKEYAGKIENWYLTMGDSDGDECD